MKRVSKQHPCPICGKPDWCMVTTNDKVLCMRVPSDKPARSGGWWHPLEGTAAPEWERLPPVAAKPSRSDRELDAIWRPRAARWREQGRSRIGQLALVLGVSVASLRELGTGWDGRAWTFPERNPGGLILGVSRRFEDGSKRCAVGSRRGLVYSDGWRETDGPVLIVEGASDTAVGITLGLAVVGRPSNTGGLRLLRRLLRGEKRDVVVVGERDRKPHDALPEALQRKHDRRCRGCPKCWPGCFGARKVAAGLAKSLRQKVVVKMLATKDLREWLNGKEVDPDDRGACEGLGKELLEVFS